MPNTYKKNKDVLKYCPNYYKVINEEFPEYDLVSGKIIQIYQEFVFSANIDKKEDMQILKNLNKAMEKYFEDREFKQSLAKKITTMKVSDKINNVLLYITKEIIKEYDKYIEDYTRNIYIPKWI